jgi:hypothetical protein
MYRGFCLLDDKLFCKFTGDVYNIGDRIVSHKISNISECSDNCYAEDFSTLFRFYPPASPMMTVYVKLAASPLPEVSPYMYIDSLLDGPYYENGRIYLFENGKYQPIEDIVNDSLCSNATVKLIFELPGPPSNEKLIYKLFTAQERKKDKKDRKAYYTREISNITFHCAYLDNQTIWLFLKGVDQDNVSFTEYGFYAPCKDLQVDTKVGPLMNTVENVWFYENKSMTKWVGMLYDQETWLIYDYRIFIDSEYSDSTNPTIKQRCGIMPLSEIKCINPLFKFIASKLY